MRLKNKDCLSKKQKRSPFIVVLPRVNLPNKLMLMTGVTAEL